MLVKNNNDNNKVFVSTYLEIINREHKFWEPWYLEEVIKARSEQLGGVPQYVV